MCFQETKLEVVDEFVCRFLWESTFVGFSYRPLVVAGVVIPQFLT